jgi:hypothetical protein
MLLSSDFKEKIMPILSNRKVKWAAVQEPNRSDDFGDSWEVEVELDDNTIAQLTTDGLAGKIKAQTDKDKRPTGVQIIRVKRKTKGNKKGGGTFDKSQPKVVDSVKRPFTGLIGNGSVCNIAYNIVKSNFGTSIDFAGIQVLELVEYGGGGPDAADEFTEVASDSASQQQAVYSDDEPPF